MYVTQAGVASQSVVDAGLSSSSQLASAAAAPSLPTQATSRSSTLAAAPHSLGHSAKSAGAQAVQNMMHTTHYTLNYQDIMPCTLCNMQCTVQCAHHMRDCE